MRSSSHVRMHNSYSEVLQYNTRLDSSTTATPKGPVGAVKREAQGEGTPSKRPKIEVLSSTEAPADTAAAIAAAVRFLCLSWVAASIRGS